MIYGHYETFGEVEYVTILCNCSIFHVWKKVKRPIVSHVIVFWR